MTIATDTLPKTKQHATNGQSQDVPINTVYQTTDYSKFNIIYENRDIDWRHVDRLCMSMSKKKVIEDEVIVNQHFEIIDGQHRFEALKRINEPIPYKVCVDYDINDVEISNRNNKPWTSVNRLNSYVKRGYYDYILIKQLRDEFPRISIDSILGISKNGANSNGEGGSQKSYDDFQNGTFELDNYNVVRDILKEIYILKDIYPKAADRRFISAFTNVRSVSEFSFDILKYKMNKYPHEIYDCGTIDQYMTMIHHVYNYNVKRNNRLTLLKT